MKNYIIAKNESEFSTKYIREIDGDLYYSHENGGENGAHDRMDGSGVWREKPIEPTRQLSRAEAIIVLLDWGLDPAILDEPNEWTGN